MKRLISLLIILIIAVTFILPIPVFATTATLTVAGEGHYTVGTYVGGGATFANLNTDDGDTQYILFPNGFAGESELHSYDMSAFAAANDHIDSVTLYVKARSVNNDVILRPVCRIGTTDYLGSDWSFTTMNYELFSYTWSVNPDTGIAWTMADINNAEFGFNRPAVNESRVTYMYVEVEYEAIGLPTVETDVAEDIAETSVTFNGEVTGSGGQNILTRGFVWDTTSVATNPGNVVPAASGYGNNWTEGAGAGNYGENPFDRPSGAVLVTGTIYFYRACAQNATGWSYGDEETFTTLDDPSINTVAATYVSATTARLNALVIDDGGQACDVRFGYDTVSRSCNFTLYTNTTAWVNDTYYKGQTPYVDITGLTAATTYYFCVQIRNDVSTQGGTEMSFTTLGPTVGAPTEFKGIPTAYAVSLAWVRGSNTTETRIMYKLGTYPTGVNDGTLVYQGAETSQKHSDLERGTTYYYSAWGKSGTTYSANYTTLMCTTLAGTSTEGMLGTMSTPTWWFAAPDYTKMNKFPFYPFINWVSDCFEIPRNTFWFLIAMFVSIFIGVLSYVGVTKAGVESFKPTLALVAEVGCMAIGTAMGLIPGWLVFLFAIFAIVSLVVGTRM